MTRSADGDDERRKGIGRSVGIVLAIAVVVALLGQALLVALDEMRFEPGPIPIDIPVTTTTEPAPRFEGTPTDEERVAYYVRVMAEHDRESAQWAKEQLLRGGDALREPLLGILRRSLKSNTAVVQHVLDVLGTRPHADMLPEVREALVMREGKADPHVLTRACELAAAIGGEGADELAPLLYDVAIDAPAPAPRFAMDALARIGGPKCHALALEAVVRIDTGYKADAYISLLQLQGDDVTAVLVKEFDAQEDPWRKLMAGEGLLRRGSTHSTEWLRNVAETASQGPAFSEAAARVLAFTRDPLAFDLLAAWSRDPLDVQRQERAVKALKLFDMAQKADVLREATEMHQHENVRLAAWEQLLREKAGGARAKVLQMLLGAGAENAEARKTAVLAIGRTPWKQASPKLVSVYLGLGPNAGDMRIYVLRAMVKCEDTETAALVVKAVAQDPAPYGVVSLAGQVQPVVHHASEEYRNACGPHIVAALKNNGAGAKRGSGLHALLALAFRCCGQEAAAVIEPFLQDEDQPLRETAAEVLTYVGRPQSMRALRAAWPHQDEYTRIALGITMARLHYRWPGE